VEPSPQDLRVIVLDDSCGWLLKIVDDESLNRSTLAVQWLETILLPARNLYPIVLPFILRSTIKTQMTPSPLLIATMKGYRHCHILPFTRQRDWLRRYFGSSKVSLDQVSHRRCFFLCQKKQSVSQGLSLLKVTGTRRVERGSFKLLEE
jgi:hypothetical protein